MAISYIKLLQAIPGAKSALNALIGAGAGSSKTIWYNVIKAILAVVAACGIGFTLSAEEVDTVSAGLAIAVPVIATLADTVASIWLRIRTTQSLASKQDRVV
jgi:hypothetical protein